MSITQTRTSDRARRGLTAGAAIGLVILGAALLGAGFMLGRGTGAADTSDPGPVAAVGEVVSAPELRQPVRPDVEPDAPRHEHVETPQVPEGPPPFEFDPPRLDLGVNPLDTEMRGMFLVKNISDEPLKILAMRADCKCTTMKDYSGHVIPPGESIEVEAVVDGRSTSGSKQSQIKFAFEGYGPASVHITSTTTRAVRADPPYITPDPNDGNLTGLYTVEALDDEPFRVLAINGGPVEYADDFDPAQDEPRSRYLLAWDLTPYDPVTCEDANGNRMPKWWVVETDRADTPIVDLQVRHSPCSLPERPGRRKWVLTKRRAVLGVVPYEGSAEFTVTVRWFDKKPTDSIRAVESESDLFDTELIEAVRDGDDMKCRVRVTPKPGVRGLVVGDARFYGYTRGHAQGFTIIARVES